MQFLSSFLFILALCAISALIYNLINRAADSFYDGKRGKGILLISAAALSFSLFVSAVATLASL